MKPRMENLLLGAALVAAIAFAVSLVSGLWFVRGDDRADAAAPGETRTAVRMPDGGPRIRVEVLNGAGKAGLARQAMDVLRDEGFDVVYFGNARGGSRDTSVVLDRVGNPEAGKKVAGALDIARHRTSVDTTRYVDVTVILGRDWRRKAEQPQ